MSAHTPAYKHSPAPWLVGAASWDDNGDARYVLEGNKVLSSADARLIASAPELLAIAQQYASECAECQGTGLVSFKTWPGGFEVDNDDQPCPYCADIRAAINKATGAP